MDKDVIEVLKNGEGVDYYILAFAIMTNDKGETIKRLADEIKPIVEKYEYKNDGDTMTDAIVRAGRVPLIVYEIVGGLPGVMQTLAKDLKSKNENDDEE